MAVPHSHVCVCVCVPPSHTCSGWFSDLTATIPDDSQPAKLRVGLSFLPDFFRGDYWVVAAGNVANVAVTDPAFAGWVQRNGGRMMGARGRSSLSPNPCFRTAVF